MVEALRTVTPDVATIGALDLDGAARWLSTSKKTVLRRIDSGELKAFKLGQQWRVRVSELELFVRRQEKRLIDKPHVQPKDHKGRFVRVG